jgi:glycosyltransferase involved in cell wall biosynthesis
MINFGPLLSIIVPIYKVEQYLPLCIESIINQTYRNLEIILVNDGSPDNCKKICDSYQKLDNRIIVIHKSNEGLVSARKSGLQISKGEYIGYVDGDDWVEPNMYEELMQLVITESVDIVAAGHKEELNGVVVEVLKNSLPSGYYSKEKLNNELYPFMICTGAFSQFGIFSYLWNKVFKREVLFPSQMAVSNEIFMAEDAACTYPAFLSANSIYVTDSNCYHYRQRVDSMVKSRDIDDGELRRYNLLYKNLYNQFSISPLSNLLIPQLDLFLLSLLTVRSGLDFQKSGKLNELFAYKRIPVGSKIVVCGAGTFGQHLIKRIQHNMNFNLVKWVDSLFHIYKNLGLRVDPYDELTNCEYDFIFVAYINEKHAELVKFELIKRGVILEKILLVNHFMEYPIKELLNRFGLEVHY